jgi:hypothetical protein
MPALLQMAKGGKTDSTFGEQLTRIFRGFAEDKDQEATGTLEEKLKRCPSFRSARSSLPSRRNGKGNRNS